MKIGMSEAAARKTMAALGRHPTDPDLIQVRERLEQGLKAATAGGRLGAGELTALIAAARHVLVGSSPATIRLNEQLNAAIPKLEALLAREESGW